MTVGAMIPARDESAEAAPAPSGQVRWIPLLIVVGLLALVGFASWKALIVIGMLLVSIVLHEVGHLLGAKWAGMRATEFFVGMGPQWSKIWSIRRGETEYGVKAFLVGGYVKTPGLTNLEEISDEHEARSYRAAPFGKRFRHVLAGPLTNLLLGLICFCVYYSVADEKVFVDGERQQIAVSPATPASAGGLRSDDIIVAIDGQTFPDRDGFVAYLRARPGQEITVDYERNNVLSTASVTLADRNPSGESVGFLGVGFGGDIRTIEGRNVLEGTHRGFTEFGRQTGATVVGIGQVFGPEGLGQLFGTVTGQREDTGQRATSVVGIARMGSEFMDGPAAALLFFAGLNMALGLFNLLPLPPFDGGHLVIALYERFQQRRRGPRYRVDFAKVMPYFAPFLIVILFVVTSAIYLDVKR